MPKVKPKRTRAEISAAKALKEANKPVNLLPRKTTSPVVRKLVKPIDAKLVKIAKSQPKEVTQAVYKHELELIRHLHTKGVEGLKVPKAKKAKDEPKKPTAYTKWLKKFTKTDAYGIIKISSKDRSDLMTRVGEVWRRSPEYIESHGRSALLGNLFV